MEDTYFNQLVINAQTQPQSIHSENEVFNYELAHLKYMEACEKYFSTPYSVTGPWTQKAKMHIINSKKKYLKVFEMVTSVYYLKPNVVENYELVLEEGEEKLVLKGTSIEILPYEECFDIFVESHILTKHGDFRIVKKDLETTFFFNDTCLTLFLSNCNICKNVAVQRMITASALITPSAFNDCVFIEILKAPIPDNDCKYILFYNDEATRFMLIRPLVAIDGHELSLELLKIFTDFGPPIAIKTTHFLLVNDVINILNRGGFKCEISIRGKENFVHESYHLMQEIVARTNEASAYWTTNCRFVQYKFNKGQIVLRNPITNKVANPLGKPFNRLFGTKYSSKNCNVANKETLGLSKDKRNEILTNDETETDTISEAEEIRSNHIMDSEENLLLSENQSESLSPDDNEGDMEPSFNPTVDMDTENSNEIKIEHNLIQTSSPQNSVEETTNLEKISEAINEPHNNDVAVKRTPEIVDSIPVKTELILEDSLAIGDSTSTMEGSSTSTQENNAGTQNIFSVGTLDSNEEHNISDDENVGVFCSICNGKMLTDFFCFKCKKKTHIFCMKRVTPPLESMKDKVISYTYCVSCLKSIYNVTNAINIIY